MTSDVNTEAWLSPAARAATIEKLEHLNLEVAYPDIWPAAGTSPLGKSFFDNLIAARTFERRRSWVRATATRARDDWEQIVYPNGAAGMAAARLMIPNGFPDAFSNSLVVTAAFLQRPLFDPEAPREVHYATFGRYMGHELVHIIEAHSFD